MEHIVISILHFNKKEETVACLRSLTKLKTDNLSIEVVVIDNGSKEKLSLDGVALGDLPVTLLRQEKNLGFAGGHNIGINYAIRKEAPFILILNNDTIVDQDLVHELVSALRENEKLALVSPKIYFAKGSEFHKKRYKIEDLGKVIWYAGGMMDWGNVIGHHRGVDEVDHGQFDKPEMTEFATGCCMLLRLYIIQKSGKFDDRYFLYYEDADLQERIKRLGYTVGYVPKGKVWHANASSSGGSGSTLQDYYISRNRLLFGFLYAPLKTKFALLRESVHLMLHGREWQKKGVKDFYRNRFGKGSYKPGT